jgi:hypothetical protein
MAHVKEIRKTPYSYTSKHGIANEAAKGNFVYVIEVHREGGITSYCLAYKYKATEAFKLAGARWMDEFIYKKSSTPGDMAEGGYFDIPVKINQKDFYKWFLSLPPGMAEIPDHLVPELETILDSPVNAVKRFV